MMVKLLEEWEKSLRSVAYGNNIFHVSRPAKDRILAILNTFALHDYPIPDVKSCFLGDVRFIYNPRGLSSTIVLTYHGTVSLFHGACPIYRKQANRCNYVWLKKKIFDHQNKIRE